MFPFNLGESESSAGFAFVKALKFSPYVVIAKASKTIKSFTSDTFPFMMDQKGHF